MAGSGDPLRIVVTGAGRGLGLEFVRQWLAQGHEVLALARDPAHSPGLAGLAVRVLACDVTEAAQVEAAARFAASAWTGVDLLVHNAGVAPERQVPLAELDLGLVAEAFAVNAIAPLRVTRAFLPLLRAGRRSRVVCLSTQMASLGSNRDGSWYGYRMSKAALNMAVVNLALELASSGLIVTALHPGWVRTDMGGPQAPLEPEAAVKSLIATIARLGPEASGAVLDYRGEPLPG